MRKRSRLRRIGSLVMKAFMGSILVVLILILARTLSIAADASAASLIAYPKFCLGGWQNPQAASGKTEVSNADISSFTSANSAFLASTVAAQLFCGYFDLDAKASQPKAVTVTFHWNMVWPTSSNNSSAPSTAASSAVTSVTTGTTVSLAAIASSTSDLSATTTSSAATSTSDESFTSGQGYLISTSTGIIVPDTTADAATTTTDTSTDTATDTTAAPADTAPAAAASATASSTTSFLDSLLRLTALPADAQTLPNDASVTASTNDYAVFSNAFLQISYSTDGVRWTTAGKVTVDNWRDYTVTIPVTSWDDLRNLQLMVNSIPTTADKPDIYLENITLNVDYPASFSDVAGSAVASVADAIDSASQAVASLISPSQPTDTSAQDQSAQQPSSQPSVEPSAVPVPPPPVLVKKLTFAVGQESEKTQKVLPWYDSFTEKNVKKSTSTAPVMKPSFAPSANGTSLSVSGSCSMQYFVILLYANATDYLNNPNSFAYNFAGPCTNGSFTYDLSQAPVTIPDGPYYLMVAGENKIGPWVPMSDMQSITIGSVIEQKPAQSSGN
jgi:hypothetical protein